MKHFFYFLLFLSVYCCSCKKDSQSCAVAVTVPDAEINALQDYISKNNIPAERDSRGFYYRVEEAGTSQRPSSCSNITVGYVGKLIDGTIFDQNPNATFALNGLIKGWQEGLPLIGEGGKITLYLPPSLGYGTNGSVNIPPNSITIFSVTLYKVNK